MLRGKTTLDPGFVLAYLRAFDRMLATGAPQPIEGFPGFKVSKPKSDLS